MRNSAVSAFTFIACVCLSIVFAFACGMVINYLSLVLR